MIENKDGIIGKLQSANIQIVDLTNYNPDNTIILVKCNTNEFTFKEMEYCLEYVKGIFPTYKVILVPADIDINFKEKNYD